MLLVRVVLALSAIAGGSSKTVNTTLGMIRGVREIVLKKKVDIFYGVPYAKSPVGNLRFKHPVPAESWGDQVKDATTKKPICQQHPTETPFQQLRNDVTALSEDCLHLNMWVPVTHGKRKLATMVYIYGGYFTSGSVNRPIYDGRYLAANNNVIVISINYRVGALGFLYLGNEDFPGNQGMMDQVLGLQWVYDNIGFFGGQTRRITLFGESAGAACVGFHMLSPLSKHLFKRAILESGSPSAFWAFKDANSSLQIASTFASQANCTLDSANSTSCIQQLPVKEILGAQQNLNSEFSFSPVIDGNFLLDDPANLFKDVVNTSVLLGVQQDEGSMFLADALPSIFSESDSIVVTRQQFLTAVNTLSYLLTGSQSLTDGIVAHYHTDNATESYVNLADDILGDSLFKCPVVKLADQLSSSNKVFMYSFKHLLASTPLSEWKGVPHSYDLEHVFGHTLGGKLQVTKKEIELSRRVMTFWSNFAKTGRPNFPVRQDRTWWPYGKTKKYLVLDTRRKLSMRRRLRAEQCQFWESVFHPVAPAT